MPDTLQIPTMSFRSQAIRSHPWVRRLWRDLFGNQRGVKLDQSAEDTVILSSQSSCISFRMSNQFTSLISALKAAMLIDSNFQYLIVCGTVQLWLNEICKSATTEKWSKIKSINHTYIAPISKIRS